MRRLIPGILLLAVVGVAVYAAGMWFGLYGAHRGPGAPEAPAVPDTVYQQRLRQQQRAASRLTPASTKEILFGDLHVHTTFSTDAFVSALPMLGGSGGAHPVGDACDYARYCSALDFWSINDHAEASTPRKWRETVETMRACNAVAGDAENADVAAFLGWEWSQVGDTPEGHYGHKNVIFKGLADDEVPTRPIGAGGLATNALRGAGQRVSPWMPLLDFGNRQDYYDFLEFLAEIREVPFCPEGVASPDLPADCYEKADDPAALFEKLDQWGYDSIVIPHGNTWGFYSPPSITWDKQLEAKQDAPERQSIFEVFSGHGNSEEYRDWRGAVLDEAGEFLCPPPSPDYLPQCWQAGEIIRGRCLEAGEDEAECERRAVEARANALVIGSGAHLTVPGVDVEDWLDSGQCRDCFLPSQSYRPGGSVQYGLAISNFDGPEPRRFRWGFIGSSDNHGARPGTGYKEYGRLDNTEATGARDESTFRRMRGDEAPEPRSRALSVDDARSFGLLALYSERQASFFTTGGLAALHSRGRSRGAVWDAMQRKEAYATSGERMLLWFHLLNAENPDGSFGPVAMGGEARMGEAPHFEVRAVGSYHQKPGCPDYAVRNATPERLAQLCEGECYNPSDERKRITRIEVVRIRPQREAGEPVAELVEDPWLVRACPVDPDGCVVRFEDPDFAADGRDSVYYVRAIQEPRERVNAGHLRCTYNEKGECEELDPCYGDFRTSRDDDCTAPAEERAWSSPIFVDYGPAS
jgi:hypothetical protein